MGMGSVLMIVGMKEVVSKNLVCGHRPLLTFWGKALLKTNTAFNPE